MAESIPFDGHNRIYAPPMEKGDCIPMCGPLYAHNNRVISMTRWKLSAEELAEINRTGEVWMAARTGERAMQPHWLGSLSAIKSMCADLAGGIWFRPPPRKRPKPPKETA